MYYCICGVYFRTKSRLYKHLVGSNPTVPKMGKANDHWQVTREEWQKKQLEAIRRWGDEV